MNLSDKIDRALARNRLPKVSTLAPTIKESEFESEIDAFLSTGPGVVAALNRSFCTKNPAAKTLMAVGVPVYKSLEEAKFGNHKVDEDGIGCIVVETINGGIKLPMKVGNFTIQDIQKRNDGLYTVQFIEE